VSSTKKLCIATGIFPPETGGPAKFVETFADWATSHGESISIVSLIDGPDTKNQYKGFDANLVSRKRPFIFRFYKTVMVLVQASRDNQVILANGLFLEVLVASYLNRGQPYFTKVPGDIVWERARNSGITNQSIDDFQEVKLSIKWRLFRYLFAKSLIRARMVIVPSQHLFDLCLRWGVRKENIRLIYNSVDTSFFKPDKNKTRWDVVTVCRLVPWKGVQEVIESCARLELSLCIIGDGPEKESLQSIARKVGCSATFLGNLDQRQVKEKLLESKYFVLNSNFEATAYALLEARACGLPSIARRNTGSEEVITSGYDGLLCDEALSLEEALNTLMKDLELSKQMSERGIEDSHVRFNMEANFQSIFNLVTDRL